MTPDDLIMKLDYSQEFFERSTSTLTEDDADFRPTPELMTPPQIIAHVAITNDWFTDAAFVNEDGFSMDFEALDKEALAFTSIDEARKRLSASYDRTREFVRSSSEEALAAKLPLGPIMGGRPKWSAILGIEEHTSHHRGQLTVYARLREKVPPMPYMA